ncbi:YqaI family protein [Heyndrickxia camelliae]|uniref:Uncharacterized protein n=1 Tax=Heyndrickxia camelliae TaxID=1707093 RepID=A0A2N3LKI2_9BACI|nr:hypothetical protein [Heyndrickxia camelliae]PKR85053.1 hypothetical protein CWO92_09805 [Heyndrickxia camelliae]
MREHPIIENIMLTGDPNLAAQPEFNGFDTFHDEILSGDLIVLDEGEVILKDHLQSYLQGEHEFRFYTATATGSKDFYGNEIEKGDRLAYDSKKENIINMEWEDDFEAYLKLEYGFQFTIAE